MDNNQPLQPTPTSGPLPGQPAQPIPANQPQGQLQPQPAPQQPVQAQVQPAISQPQPAPQQPVQAQPQLQPQQPVQAPAQPAMSQAQPAPQQPVQAQPQFQSHQPQFQQPQPQVQPQFQQPRPQAQFPQGQPFQQNQFPQGQPMQNQFQQQQRQFPQGQPQNFAPGQRPFIQPNRPLPTATKGPNPKALILGCLGFFGVSLLLFVIFVVFFVSQTSASGDNGMAKALGVNPGELTNTLITITNLIFGLVVIITFFIGVFGMFRAAMAPKTDKPAKSSGYRQAAVASVIFLIMTTLWVFVSIYLSGKKVNITPQQKTTQGCHRS